MSILYDDMLIEILLWLPAKSLIKFKLVCKHWRSIIFTDQFCHLHTLRHPKTQPSLILDAFNASRNTSHFFYFDPIFNPHKIIPYTFTIPNPQILSSCNGLLLLQSDQPEKCFYVYNLTTRRSRKISLNNSDEYAYDLGLSLAFDPSISSHYKIVCVKYATKWAFYGERCCQIEVYESQRCMWNPRVKQFTMNSNFWSSGVYWKNKIHIFNSPPSQYFDIDNYVIGDMPPEPKYPPYSSGVTTPLQESNGHLYLIRGVSPRHGDGSIQVYELQVDYSRWLIKYDHVLGQPLPQSAITMRFIQGDDGDTGTLVYHVSSQIMAYRFLDKITEELVDLTDQPFYYKYPLHFHSDYHHFGESMAPV